MHRKRAPKILTHGKCAIIQLALSPYFLLLLVRDHLSRMLLVAVQLPYVYVDDENACMRSAK